MKLLSFQPFSLSSNSGGGRILRRLYQGHEADIISLGISVTTTKKQRELKGANSTFGGIPETLIAAHPLIRPWQRWYARDFANWLREKALKQLTSKRLRKAAASLSYDVIHVVDHYSFSSALCNDLLCNNKILWVSFHDHFSTTNSSYNNTKQLWQKANRRLCISNEIGTEYQKLFGKKSFEIITDGVKTTEISDTTVKGDQPLVIYFAGMLHFDYLPLFKALGDALDLLSKQGIPVKLILRGTYKTDVLNNREFEVEYRPVTLNEKELKEELDSASILYLPMYFNVPDFYLYSLSTKMIGYLGASGSILYHGPTDSAACVLLEKNNAAVCCKSLDLDELIGSIKKLLSPQSEVSQNAKVLARSQFSLDAIKKRFWQES